MKNKRTTSQLPPLREKQIEPSKTSEIQSEQDDKVSGYSSSAMCGFDFPENDSFLQKKIANELNGLQIGPIQMSAIKECQVEEMEQSPLKIKKKESLMSQKIQKEFNQIPLFPSPLDHQQPKAKSKMNTPNIGHSSL